MENHPQHAPLIERLKDKRVQILEIVQNMDEAGRPVELDQTLQGRISRMDAIAHQQMARAGQGRLLIEVKRIDAALERHRRGSYGLCCRCGERVDRSRLDADPATPFCLDCAEAIDRSQGGRDS